MMELAACAHLSPHPLIKILLQGLNKGCFRHSADDCVHLLAVLEDHDCGDASDAILCRNSWALVRVELELHNNTTNTL